MKKTGFLFVLLVFFGSQLQAQYFGRNKPRYREEPFIVLETQHFDIHHYLENPEKLEELAVASELWFRMHKAVLQDTFSGKNPLIFHNDHAGFQQTSIIQGNINVGTGGVTEGLRNRVIMPLAMTNQQTNHVLGHELVHAFQYNMVLNGDSTNMNNLRNLPLWMVEGLAEYLSIGRVDAHTSLWMRDAVMNSTVPRIKDLDKSIYFPYRWGQAFWAYMAGTYGDEVIKPLFLNTAKYGLQAAVPKTVGISVEELSKKWESALYGYYGQWTPKGVKEKMPGKLLLSDENAGTMNTSLTISPNGKYVIFLSEKNVFTTELYVADLREGKIIKKITSTTRNATDDQLNMIESAGSWSPDSKRFVYDVYDNGRSTLVFKDALSGKTRERVSFDELPAFCNPAWSPDGKTIVVTGLLQGQTDLWSYDLKKKKLSRLTNDAHSEILPSWSSDGRYLAYSTDELSRQRGRTNGVWVYNMAIMDMTTGEKRTIDVFPGADNLNPQFDKEGRLLFVSNRDGFRNLYRYDLDSNKMVRLTNLKTGITGITPYSHAFSVADDQDRIVYTCYQKGNYNIYQARAQQFDPVEVDPQAVDFTAATLPPFGSEKTDVVNVNLRNMDNNKPGIAASMKTADKPYKPQFELEYLGGSAGVGVVNGNSSFGVTSGLAGGIDMLFGDMLGYHQLYAGVAMNGSFEDIAGQFAYMNTKKRINWGINLSHFPNQTGQYHTDNQLGEKETMNGETYTGYRDELILQRVFQERVGAFAMYPFSSTKRVEVGGAFEYYHQRVDQYYYYISPEGYTLGSDKRKLTSEGSQVLANLNTAYVGDNAYFGLTSPLAGWRYRIGFEHYFGAYNFNTVLLDGRYYKRIKPITLAVRGMTYNRFGGNANNLDEVYPLFVAQTYFIRGYTSNILYNDVPELVEWTVGSKLAVANFEVRLPLTGPKIIALLPSRALFTDLNFFVDSGMAWYTTDDLRSEDPDPYDGIDHVQHRPIFSMGVSLRINLFGAFVLEPYYAIPLSVPREFQRGVFGLNIVPGW